MVFHWEPNTDEVAAQIVTLPAAARVGLHALLDAVVFDPLEYGRTNDEPAGKPVRMLPFDAGRGLVTIQVYEPDGLVLVLRVQWSG